MHSSPTSPVKKSTSSTNVTIAYFTAFIILGIVTSSLGPTLPGLASQTNSPLSQISLLFTTRSLGYLLGSLLGGWLFDRVRGHPVLVGALIIMGVALFLVPNIPVLWVLAITLTFIGLGEGILDVGGNTLMVWLHGKGVGPFMSGLHFFFGIGAFLSPLFVAQALVITGGIKGAYWLFAFLILPLAFWLFRLPSPLAPQVQLTKENDHRSNHILLALIVIFMVLYVGSEVSFGSWAYTYGLSRDLTEVSAAYLTSIFWGAFTLSRLISIPVSARVRPSKILLVNFVGASVSLGLMLSFPDDLFVLWVAAFGFGFSIAPIFPTMVTFTGNRMAITGRVTSLLFLGATIGGMFFPWFIGQRYEVVGPEFFIYALTFAILSAFGVFSIIFFASDREKETRR